jgi:hypothetical protein
MLLSINKFKALMKRGLLQLLLERLMLRATYWVSWNTEYRPTSVADICEVHAGVEVDRIQEQVVSRLRLPRPFYDVMLNKGYDAADVSESVVEMHSTPEDFIVAKLKGGRVYSDNLKTSAIITSDGGLLSGVSFQYVGESVSEASSQIFKQCFFKTPTHVEGTVFVMLAGGLSGRGNYYHWLIDILPRLYLLQQSRFSGKIDKYLVPQFDREFQKTSLRLMGVRDDQVIVCTPFTHLSCRDLVVASHPRGRRSLLVPDWVFNFYAEFKLKLIDRQQHYAKRIYITRKDSNLRGVYDEDRLISYLAQFGFEPVTLAEHDFDKKVNIFHAAEYIISQHGAGLTNLLFANEGCKLLELFSEGFVNPVLLNLAERRKVDYYYLIFNHQNAAHEDAKGQYEDLFVDYIAMERTLKVMLCNQ